MRIKILNVFEVLLRKIKKPPTRVTISYKKVFIIGDNKTGNSSLRHFYSSLGCKIGNQEVGEALTLNYLRTVDTEDIINYTFSAEVFQDHPFSCRDLYK